MRSAQYRVLINFLLDIEALVNNFIHKKTVKFVNNYHLWLCVD